MSSTIYCSQCGANNPYGQATCWKCGARLIPSVYNQQSENMTTNPPPAQTVPAPTIPPAAYPYPSAQQSYTPPAYGTSPQSPGGAVDYYGMMRMDEQRKGIDRTKTGLLLLVIGLLLSSLPYFGLIGGILSIIGAILVIISREVFGSDHARNTIISLVTYLVGTGVGIAAAGVFTFSVFTSILPQTSTSTVNYQTAIQNAIPLFVALTIAAAVLVGLAEFLFTHALQDSKGRFLLIAAFAANIIVSTITAVFTISVLTTLAGQITSGNPAFTPEFVTQTQSIGLLGLIPAALFAVAYLLARGRVVKGEIPVQDQRLTPAPPTSYGKPAQPFGQPPPP